MIWSDLVDAVATLSPEQELRMLDEAHRKRAEQSVPEPAEPAGQFDGLPVSEPSFDAPAPPAPALVADMTGATDPAATGWGYPTGSYGAPLHTPSGLPREDGVPTMDDIREKIEGRAARAEGQTILDAESQAGRQRAEDEQARTKAAEDILARIRASINDKG